MSSEARYTSGRGGETQERCGQSWRRGRPLPLSEKSQTQGASLSVPCGSVRALTRALLSCSMFDVQPPLPLILCSVAYARDPRPTPTLPPSRLSPTFSAASVQRSHRCVTQSCPSVLILQLCSLVTCRSRSLAQTPCNRLLKGQLQSLRTLGRCVTQPCPPSLALQLLMHWPVCIFGALGRGIQAEVRPLSLIDV